MSKVAKDHLIHAMIPENMDSKEIKSVVIPALRKEVKKEIEACPDWFRCMPENFAANTILERAEAIAGDLEKMSRIELDRSVRILREEIGAIKDWLKELKDEHAKLTKDY